MHELFKKNILKFRQLHLFGWGSLFLLLVGAIQFNIPSPMDGDTAYHAAVGYLISDHGILHAFPWTPFSWLADHYADKELLFHLLFVPFLKFGWIRASQIVGTLCGSLILLTIYLILRREGAKYPWLWALLPLATSHTFVYRFSIVRPHLLSITLAIIVVWAAARGKLRLVAAVSAIYPWAYVAWFMPLVLITIAMVARYVSVRTVSIKPLFVCIGGIVIGVVFHPNSSNLVRLAWIQIVDVLFSNAWGEKAGFDLGLEFLPETPEGWMKGLLISVVMAVAAMALSWRRRRDDYLPLAYALATVGYALMTAKSSRFLEYFVPFSVVAMALAARPIRWRWLPQVLLAISLVYTFSLNYRFLRSFADSPDCQPPSVVSFLREKIPPGSQVFTADWASTGGLMLALPERKFIVGLDPTFFYLKDPDLYRLWYTISHDAPPNTVEQIRRHFSARYVVCFYPNRIIPQEWNPFLERLSTTPGVTTRIVDDLWVFFDLGEAKGK